eukprot:3333644-Pyramimonas_sp.AAC.1
MCLGVSNWDTARGTFKGRAPKSARGAQGIANCFKERGRDRRRDNMGGPPEGHHYCVEIAIGQPRVVIQNST